MPSVHTAERGAWRTAWVGGRTDGEADGYMRMYVRVRAVRRWCYTHLLGDLCVTTLFFRRNGFGRRHEFTHEKKKQEDMKVTRASTAEKRHHHQQSHTQSNAVN